MDIYVRDGGRCRSCLCILNQNSRWQIDHVVPLSRGGTNARSNLQLLCAGCHASKTAREDGGFGRAVPASAGGSGVI